MQLQNMDILDFGRVTIIRMLTIHSINQSDWLRGNPNISRLEQAI
jgi:hypothetical protein